MGGGGKAAAKLIEGWALIEADFQREYRIDIAADLASFSWRRFSTLLRGLGPDSAYRLAGDKKIITDPEEAERLVESMFGG